MAAAEMNSQVDVEQLIDALADLAPVKARDLADKVETEYLAVRDKLIELEEIGLVYRTGRTRGTRWWLG